MKLGVMQPYFFPYIGYFELINRCDKWIVFDTVQYIQRGWMHRNRILHPSNKDWQYVIVPTQKHPLDVAIKDVRVQPGREWKDKIIGQLAHYRKVAPFYDETVDLVRRGLEPDEESLSRLNVHTQKVVCDYLGIPFTYEYFSEMDLSVGPVEAPGEWGLRISEALGADEFINPPGGASFVDPGKYEDAGVKLTFQKLVEFPYDCRRFDHVPGLSIIDVCMWNSPERIKSFLDVFSYDTSTPESTKQRHIGSYLALPGLSTELVVDVLEHAVLLVG